MTMSSASSGIGASPKWARRIVVRIETMAYRRAA